MAEFVIEDNFGSVSKKLRRIAKLFPKELERGMFNAGNKIAQKVKEKTPKQSGKLSKSIKPRDTGPLEFTITSSLKYNDFVEFGVGRFGPKNKDIKPVRKKALRWISLKKRPFRGRAGGGSQGNVVFSKRSKGFKGFFMFTKTEGTAKLVLKAKMLKTLREITKKIDRIKARIK